MDCNRSDVLVETMQLRCPRDRYNPRLLSKQPSNRDLSRCCLLLVCKLPKQIDQCLVCFPCLGGKARDYVSEVGAIEFRILVDLAREESRAKRAERNEANSEFLDCRKNLRLRTSSK
jgi:hypothetical protein